MLSGFIFRNCSNKLNRSICRYFSDPSNKYKFLNIEENNKTILCKLNNPSKKNALSIAMVSELEDFVFQQTHHNTSSVNSIVLMSNSPGYFCTGADLKERTQMTEQEIYGFVLRLRNLFYSFQSIPVPTFAFIGNYYWLI